MLHAREDYNRIQDPENKIPQDEPVFLLRGQDMFAPKLLLKWAAELRLAGGSKEMARIVEDHAQKMIEWQRDKGAKIPDLPNEQGWIPGSHFGKWGQRFLYNHPNMESKLELSNYVIVNREDWEEVIKYFKNKT